MSEGDPSTQPAANTSGNTVAPNDVKLFDEGVQALKDTQFERAVQVLGEVLQLRIDKYGERDLETASAYYRYGCALFYRAQEESDVFGAQLKSTVTAREEASSGLPGAAKQEDAGKKPEEAASSTAEAEDPKGKAVAQPPVKEQEEGVVSGEDADDSAEEEEELEDDDIELSWKMLEVARTIYIEQGGIHKSELADVHMLLADHSTEQENYETALEDLKRALVLLQSELKEDDRQLAALHYKMGLALQSMDRPSEALAEIKVAKRICQERLDNLRKEAKEGKQEMDDLEAVMEELMEKEQELVEAGKELQKAKDSLKSLFQGAMGGGSLVRPAASGQVIDLGVAGQGRKRIDATTTQVVQRGGESALGTARGAAATAKQTKPKRTLEDLMGSEAAPKFSFQPSTAAEGLAAKKARTELQEHNGQSSNASDAADKPSEAANPQTLPGFLQPGSVQAIYGNQEKGAENGNQSAKK